MKKVFAILSIVFILFVFIVPCFAVSEVDDYQIYIDSIFQPITSCRSYNSNYTTIYRDYDSISVEVSTIGDHLNYELGIYLNCVTPLVSYHRYIFIYQFNTNLTFQAGSYNSFSHSIFTGISGGNILIMPPSHYEGVFTISQFICIDVTDLYNAGYTTYDSCIEQLSKYVDVTQPYFSSGHYHLIDFFNPLTDFLVSPFHVFDYFSEIVSTYSAVFVFVSICLTLCLLIFILAMVFRRCRNI